MGNITGAVVGIGHAALEYVEEGTRGRLPGQDAYIEQVPFTRDSNVKNSQPSLKTHCSMHSPRLLASAGGLIGSKAPPPAVAHVAPSYNLQPAFSINDLSIAAKSAATSAWLRANPFPPKHSSNTQNPKYSCGSGSKRFSASSRAPKCSEQVPNA